MIEADLLKRAWTYAAEHEMQKQALVAAALREFLDRRQRRKRST
jgi:hypothetical protein